MAGNAGKRIGSGFTIIELLVTVAILAVLLAAAVPAFTDFMDKSRVRGAADAVVSLIATARSEAVKASRDVTVAVGGTTAAWCVGANMAAVPALTLPIPASAECDCTTAGACQVAGVPRVVESTEFGDTTVSAVGADFVLDGKLGSLAGLAGPSIDVVSPSGKYTLTVAVSPLGHSRACTPSGKPKISGYEQC